MSPSHSSILWNPWPKFFPFRAYRYNPAKAEPARVLTQPYDKITAEMQQRYAELSPYNLITVEKGLAHPGDSPADDVYTRAANALEQWIAENVLVKDSQPSFYAYFQAFEVPSSQERRLRQGLIALGKIEDYSAGIVFRHEQTLAGPKADRLELLRHTRAHTASSLCSMTTRFAAWTRSSSKQQKAPPETDFRDEYGVTHSLWRISDPQAIAKIQTELAAKKLVIADGHHRYETALAYRNECRAQSGSSEPNAPWERVMMTLVNARSDGLVILPTHRVVSGLPHFDAAALQSKLAPYFQTRSTKLPADSAQWALLPAPRSSPQATPAARSEPMPEAIISSCSHSRHRPISRRRCPTSRPSNANSTWSCSTNLSSRWDSASPQKPSARKPTFATNAKPPRPSKWSSRAARRSRFC